MIALKSRVQEARNDLLKSLKFGETAAVVSHLQVTRSILSDALDMPTNKMTELKILTASIACIDYEQNDNDNNNTTSCFHKATVHFSNFKPDAGLEKANDGGNFV